MSTPSVDSLIIKQIEDTKKKPPNLNPKAFTGEEDVDEGGSVNLNTLQGLINSCKIDLTEKLAPPPVALQIIEEGKPVTLFTKGNFSIVTGAAKSRKTFLISMLLAAAIKGSLQDKFLCPTSGVNLLFDTEQSRYKAQQVAKRIYSLSDKILPENFQVYSLRTLEPSERINLIESVLANTPNINLVAIDGIIDLDIDPILQAEQAQQIISKLMRWTDVFNIHIVCVLHFNKTVETLAGHIGTFSHRKADAIISVKKCKDDEGVSLVEPVDCREKEFKPFAFTIDPAGMPYIIKDYIFKGGSKEKKGASVPKRKSTLPAEIDQQIHNEILRSTFKIQKEPGYGDLWRNTKNAIQVITGKSIGDNNAKDFVTYYQNSESIIKVDVPKKKTFYTLAGQGVLISNNRFNKNQFKPMY